MFDAKRITLLCAASFTLGASVALLLAACVRSWQCHQGFAQPAPATRTFEQGHATPACGTIEAIEIPLANPDGVFPDRQQRLASPQWFFQDFSETHLTHFLNSCALRPSEQRMLLDKRSWKVIPNGIIISPPEQLIWSLQPRSREQIYSLLARSPVNFPQCFPFRFPLAGFDRRFNRSDLTVTGLEKVKRLAYTNSGYLCFTDLQAVKLALTPDEFNDLIETL